MVVKFKYQQLCAGENIHCNIQQIIPSKCIWQNRKTTVMSRSNKPYRRPINTNHNRKVENHQVYSASCKRSQESVGLPNNCIRMWWKEVSLWSLELHYKYITSTEEVEMLCSVLQNLQFYIKYEMNTISYKHHLTKKHDIWENLLFSMFTIKVCHSFLFIQCPQRPPRFWYNHLAFSTYFFFQFQCNSWSVSQGLQQPPQL